LITAESAWKLKVQRARQHQLALEAALREYSQLHPFDLISNLEENDLVVRVHMKHEIPAELSLIVGDLLHNARSALDLLVMAASRVRASESGRQLSLAEERSLSFPITRTKLDSFTASRSQNTSGLPHTTVTNLIESILLCRQARSS
jgi:hypothetical protein